MKSLAVCLLAVTLILPALPADATGLGRSLAPARKGLSFNGYGTFGGSGLRGGFHLGTGRNSFRSGNRMRQRNGFNNRRGGYGRGYTQRGYTNWPGNVTPYGGGSSYYGGYNQPPLTLSREQLFFQRYLNERAQSKREILGTKDSTLELNRDLFGGNLLNPGTRGATGGTYGTPFALPSVQTSPTSSATQNTGTLSLRPDYPTAPRKARTPLRRQLKKTNPMRGVISPVPLTRQQKARINF